MYRKLIAVPSTLALLFLSVSSYGQSSSPARTLITQAVNESKLVTLANNTSPKATSKNDRGPVASSLPMQHLWLQLKRPPEQQAALDRYAAAVSDPRSPNFGKWLTARQVGQQYGLADADIAQVSEWLTSRGLKVEGVTAGRTLITFSGTAGQVGTAFHTSIHNLMVAGKPQISNMTDPRIPEALEPAVAGIVKLNNIRPRPMHTAPSILSAGKSNFSDGAGNQFITPQDFATIYNLNPLFQAGYTGRGQTIAVLEDSNVYSTSEWTQFRKLFGLTRPFAYGSLTQIHPSSPALACADPGVVAGTDGEATLDAQWASAAAPNANIVVASCSDDNGFGVYTAMVNLLDGPNPPAIMSISYGAGENDNGDAAYRFVNATYQQAAVEGVSVFVSSGDSGADSALSDGQADVAYQRHQRERPGLDQL